MTGQSAARQQGQLHFAIVGAGVAGLACARELVAGGVRATVFERANAVGGRLASQRRESGVSDLGAQFLTARSEPFAAQIRAWGERGAVQRWAPVLAEFDKGSGSFVKSTLPCFVGVPAMQSIAELLAADLDIVFGAQAGRLARGSAEWYLFDTNDRPLGISGFDGLVLAVPSVAALELVRGLAEFAPEIAGKLSGSLGEIAWEPCWTASVTLSRASGIEFDAAFIRDDPILVWAARESSKPARASEESAGERWLLQARATWSRNFAQLPPEEAGRWMQRAFAARLGRALMQKSCTAVHWPHATPARFLQQACLWDPSRTFGLCGDWCGGANVESAFLSGQAIGRAIVAA